MAVERIGEDFSNFTFPNKAENAATEKIEVEMSPESQEFTNTLSKLVAYINEARERGLGKDDQDNRRGDKKVGTIQGMLFADLRKQYYEAMSTAESSSNTSNHLQNTYKSELGRANFSRKEDRIAAEAWMDETVENEILKLTFEEIGHEVNLLSSEDMANYSVDYEVVTDDDKLFVASMHNIPVIEMPNSRFGFNSNFEGFETQFSNDQIDSNYREGVDRDLDIEKKRRLMRTEFAKLSDQLDRLIKDKYDQELRAGNHEATPHKGMILATPALKGEEVIQHQGINNLDGVRPDRDRLTPHVGYINWEEYSSTRKLQQTLERDINLSSQDIAPIIELNTSNEDDRLIGLAD